MANQVTKLGNLINPQVMADIISAKVGKKIRFSPLAKIDDTLTGQAGNTITVPKFAYIGDAADVAEGVECESVLLTASTTQATVKKAMKSVDLTDEALLSGYGDPVGEATNQLALSIAQKIDNDCLTALEGATLVYDGSAAAISYNGVVDAVDVFGEEDQSAKVMFVHPKQMTQLRKDANFQSTDKYPMGSVVMTGVVGSIAGVQILPSKKVKLNAGGTAYENYIVKVSNNEEEADEQALTIYLKKDVSLETDRNIKAKINTFVADEHYVAVLSNDSKVVKATFKK